MPRQRTVRRHAADEHAEIRVFDIEPEHRPTAGDEAEVALDVLVDRLPDLRRYAGDVADRALELRARRGELALQIRILDVAQCFRARKLTHDLTFGGRDGSLLTRDLVLSSGTFPSLPLLLAREFTFESSPLGGGLLVLTLQSRFVLRARGLRNALRNAGERGHGQDPRKFFLEHGNSPLTLPQLNNPAFVRTARKRARS